MSILSDPPLLLSSLQWEQRNRRNSLVWIGIVVLLTGIVGVPLIGSPESGPSLIAWAIYIATIVATFRQPRYGVYALVFFALASDKLMLYWYPFAKNLSSMESVMFLNKSFIFSPLELSMVLTLVAWLGGGILHRNLKFRKGVLFWPVMIFAAFMAFGLIYGLARRGNSNIALWEARPMFYLPVMYVLVVNLIDTRAQANKLMWLAAISIFWVGGIAGPLDFIFNQHGEISRIESMVEHSAAIRFNIVYVMAIVAWMYKASASKRILLPLMSLPMLVTYVVAQRRASYIALALAVVFIGFFLFIENRKWFWRIAPPLAVVAVLYLGAFWNNQSALGLPARAIKSVISSDSGSAQENSSNDYRLIENINDLFTVRMAPITGVGFGNKFYIIVPLPDISFFAWWEYIVHNSVMYIWMKTGFGGFYSMVVMVGLSLVVGMRAALRMPGGDMSAITLTALLYIFMHYVYAYVDMSWDNLEMVCVGAMTGLLCSMEDIVARPIILPPKRYPWQPDPSQPPGLREV